MNLDRIKAEIAYQRSFTISERVERAKDKACLWLARRLPARLIMWVVVARHADHTSGAHGNRHPDTVKAFELYDKAA